MVFQALHEILVNLAEINQAAAEKKALEIERTDAQTDTQSVFIVYYPYYVTDHRLFRDL